MVLPHITEKRLPASILPARWRGYTKLSDTGAGLTKRWLIVTALAFGATCATVIYVLNGMALGVESKPDTWGWTEQMGWVPTKPNLTDLGEVAENRYRLAIDDTDRGQRDYFQLLSQFSRHVPNLQLRHYFQHSIHNHLPPSLINDFPLIHGEKPILPTSMVSYKWIHQTDKLHDGGELSAAWRDLNAPDGWDYNFMSDRVAQEWIDEIWQGSTVEWAWKYMHRGVLRADFLRYLMVLVEGGVYADVDTKPLRRIEEWGLINPEILNISATDGPNWQQTQSIQPAVIVAIDVDVHAYKGWESSWPRPLGICQWTLSSAAYHPIMLDAVRRVVNATQVVETFSRWKQDEIRKVKMHKEEGWEERVKELVGMRKEEAMNVMEWTGPGLFTDSVMAYLLARYNVTWHRFRGLDHPLRIGEVMVLPITAFSPGGQPDFEAEGPDSPQADVLHNFRGGWKGGQ